MKTASITTNTFGLMLLSIILLAAVANEAYSREKLVSLRGDWRFILGDSKKFARPDYNDSDWEKVYVPAWWQDEGFQHYHGYAWYRKTVDINFDVKEALYLELGIIDDVDEVYLNGHLIGATGGFPPDYFTAHRTNRRYFMPPEHVRNGKANVIAVRIYDEGGAGGIMGDNIGIYSYASNYTENSFPLVGNWKFHLSDDAAWSAENMDDSGWDRIAVPSAWEEQGFKDYDGFAWYRKKFKLPASFSQKDMLIIAGKIDDLDEVFINGELVGGTGNMKTKRSVNEEWSKYRTYSIPDGLLKPGRENVIAVRVYDQVGAGGMYEGPLVLVPRSEYKLFWKKYRSENFDISEWLAYFFD